MFLSLKWPKPKVIPPFSGNHQNFGSAPYVLVICTCMLYHLYSNLAFCVFKSLVEKGILICLIRKIFHAKMGSIEDRNGRDLT